MRDDRMFYDATKLRRKLGQFDRWLAKMSYPYKTITRLAEFLECDRATVLKYARGEHKVENMTSVEFDEYLEVRSTLQKVLTQIEGSYEDMLFASASARGGEFTLKNNYLWTDRQEVQQDTSVTVKMKGEELADFSK